MATQFDTDIVAWQNVSNELARVKQLETELRKKVFGAAFAEPKYGVNNLELGKGYTLKGTLPLNYNLKETVAGAETSVVLDQIEKLGNEGSFIAERLVTWKPSLSVKEYKALDVTNPTQKKIKDLIDSVLTTSDGLPTLEVVVPKV